MIKEAEILLSLQDLNKHYGDLKAVSNLSFQVKKGEIFGLLGPNGAGKTTTIECILGTRKADSGSISLLNTDLKERSKNFFEKIGVQFQDSHYPELIKVGELCRMTSVLYKNPGDYKTLLKQFSLRDKEKNRVSELSGGEKQKLSLVLALINNPSLVFLDELTTGLDPQARRDVWSYLSMLKEKGMTIVLTSHYMDEVRYLCDRIMIMNKGEEVISGTPENVISQSGMETMEEAYLHYVKEEKLNEENVYAV
ncbi:MAG: ABC transporter ATP-binding protein [Spirochaetaceae bacterium]|nr:ABC transporter ATP-binding protein [Spirochaetaceae bacterium]